MPKNVLCIMIIFNYCILYIPPWQVPHPMVSVHNDGFMEYNKWWWWWQEKALENKTEKETCISVYSRTTYL